MGELASKSQLRMSFIRWAVVMVPLIVFLGFASGKISNSGFGNGWFDALQRPAWFPPAAAFGIVWTILYVLMGVALAMILDARGARDRGIAIGLFAVQLALNLAWSPLFFAAHQISLALWLMLAILIAAALTAWAFGKIRKQAGLLLLPYLVWILFALVLNFEMDRLNPNAETLRPPPSATEFLLPTE